MDSIKLLFSTRSRKYSTSHFCKYLFTFPDMNAVVPWCSKVKDIPICRCNGVEVNLCNSCPQYERGDFLLSDFCIHFHNCPTRFCPKDCSYFEGKE